MRSSDGGGLRRLTANPYGGHDIPADYSPDGSFVLFLRENPQLAHDGRFALFRVRTDGTGLTQVTRWALNAGGGRWSPDGSSIVLSVGSGRVKGSLWVMRPDGTGLHKVFQDSQGGFAFQPTWSPRGDEILFALIRTFQGSGEDLYSLNADGTELTQVTKTPDSDEDSPDWGTYSG
jgi:Tol biopolymer transport system component